MVAETETKSVSFFDRPGVEKGVIQVGRGIPFGLERVTNSSVGIGGVYGTWGESYDNDSAGVWRIDWGTRSLRTRN